MKPMPFSTKPNVKDPVAPNAAGKNLPEQTQMNRQDPVELTMDKKDPEQTEPVKVIPVEGELTKEVPAASGLTKEMPQQSKENYVVLNGKEIEIKSTKLKYFRNKMASAYSVLKVIPLNELLVYGKGTFDENRDADQLLFDFLVAVFDDPVFVRDNYDNMTADEVEQIFKIFGRLNHIDEKEEQQRKNREAQVKH